MNNSGNSTRKTKWNYHCHMRILTVHLLHKLSRGQGLRVAVHCSTDAEAVIGSRRGSGVALYLAKTIILFTFCFDALAVHAANLLTEAQGVLAHSSKLVTVEVTKPLERGNAVILADRKSVV